MEATQKKSALSVNMTEGSLWKNMLLFSLPLMLTQVLEVLFNLSDVAIAGKFADYRALGAVGSTTLLVSLFTGLLIGMGSGVNVAVARGLGMGDRQRVEKTVHTSFVLCAAIGVVLCLICVLLARPMLTLLHTKDELMDGAVLYLKIYALSMPAMAVYNCGNGILSATGDTKRPLIYLSVAGVLNVLLNLFFVAVLHMTVNGVAIATVMANAFSSALLFRRLLRSGKDIRLEPRRLRMDGRSLWMILRIGLPAGLQSAVFAISNIVIQSAINSLGKVVMAASSAACNIEVFAYDVMNSYNQACTTFVGQNYGAGRLDRVKKGTWVTLAMGLVYTLATGALLLLGQDAIMHLFTNDETVVFFGEAAMHWFCPFYFLLSILHGLAGAVRGTGASVPPMVVLLVSLCLFRIVWIQWVLPLFSGIEGVFILYPVSWALGAGLMILYAWKGKWMEYHA